MYELLFKNTVGSYWLSCWQHQHPTSQSIPLTVNCEQSACWSVGAGSKAAFPNLPRHQNWQVWNFHFLTNSFLGWGLTLQSKLAWPSLCNLCWPPSPETLASDSSVLGFQALATTPSFWAGLLKGPGICVFANILADFYVAEVWETQSW